MWLLLLRFPRCCLNTERGRCINTSVQPSGLRKRWRSTERTGAGIIIPLIAAEPARPQPAAGVMRRNSSPIIPNATRGFAAPTLAHAGVGGMRNYRARCYLNSLLQPSPGFAGAGVSKLSHLGPPPPPHASEVWVFSPRRAPSC